MVARKLQKGNVRCKVSSSPLLFSKNGWKNTSKRQEMSVAKKHRKHKQTTKKRYDLSVVNCYPHLCRSQKSLQQYKGQRVPGFNQCGLAHKKVWQKDNRS